MLNRLKNIRENNEISQRQLANRLNISKSNYSRWETGEQIIPLKRLNQISNYYHINMDYIIGISKFKYTVKEINELNKKEIGKRIREIRIEHNLTQEDLAKILNTTHSTISAYENGKTLILTAFALQLCKKYHYSLDWLCGKK